LGTLPPSFISRRRQRAFLLRLVVCGSAMACPGLGFAQPSPTPDSARAELAAIVDLAYPAVVLASCCQLRTPPEFFQSEARFKRIALGGEARINWVGRMSTLLDVSASGDADYFVEYVRPMTAPAPVIPGSPATYVTSRTSRRSGWAVSVIQSIDISHQRRWRPWLGGGISFERLHDHYEQSNALFVDRSPFTLFSVDREEITIAAVATGGIRFSLGRQAFVATTGILHFYIRGTPFRSQFASCRLGVGIRL
jgi:hypothetical protein